MTFTLHIFVWSVMIAACLVIAAHGVFELRRYFATHELVFDTVVNSERDGLPLLLIKHLVHLSGRRIDLHCIIYPDPWECFHSHPAGWSIRIILWGGYVEELYDGTMKEWKPGMIGIVRHDMVHRINRLRFEQPSYSLWIRGKIRHGTMLKGTGWPIELQDTTHRSSQS